jgi:RNA polymerase sigma-70 factor (ECF subfamily)
MYIFVAMIDDRHIQNIAADNYAAFVELHQELYKRLFYYLYKMQPVKELCEDILQETFLKYWENRKNFKDYLSVKVYLFTVARNFALHHFRDDATHQRLLEDIVPENMLTEDHLLITAEVCAMVQQAIAELPAQSRRVIELAVEEHTVAEIADLLHISPNTVKTLKKSAYAVLRTKLSHLKGLLPLLLG